MAIKIEWQALPIREGKKDKQSQLFPRVTENKVVDFQHLCKKVENYGSHTRGTVECVISDVVDVMAELLAEGMTVSLELLGTFRLSIGADGPVTPDISYRNRRVAVCGINFQPHRALMDVVGSPEFHIVSCDSCPVILSAGQLQKFLLSYFREHDFITRPEFERLCQLKRTAAGARLNEFVEAGSLRRVGCNRVTRYELVREEDKA